MIPGHPHWTHGPKPSLKQPCFAWEQLLESKSPTYNNLSQLRLRPIHLNQGYQHDLVYMRINRIMHVYMYIYIYIVFIRMPVSIFPEDRDIPKISSMCMGIDGSPKSWGAINGASWVWRRNQVNWVRPWKINGWNLQITHLERKMIWTKPPWGHVPC